MSTYIPLKSQFNADQSFLGNYGLKMYGSEIQGVKVYDEVITFQRAFWDFFGHVLTYIPLERQFDAEQNFLGNHGLKMSTIYVIIFQTDVFIFPNMLIFVP